MTQHKQEGMKQLREKAEASVAEQQPEIADLSIEQIRKLVHELQVHQIELELQNEELRRLMTELEQSRNQFSILFHQAPIGYLALDDVGLIHETNETFCRMVGRNRNQLLGSPFADCLEGDDRSVFLSRYRAFFKNPIGKNLEALIPSGPDAAFHAHMEGTIIATSLGRPQRDNQPLLLLTITDISERKRAEERRLQLERQMQQTQKLESLGVLAGGIAHDFNNLLTIILGNTSLALDDLPPLSPAGESLLTIEKTSLRAAELCRQILAYSGKGRFVIDDIRLGNLVGDMFSLLQSSISKKATLNLNLKEPLPPLHGDPGQIRQVIMNLVTNASEAVGDRGGVITISTGLMQCSREYLCEPYLYENLAEGLYVWFEVSDTGTGMDQETQRRIFEPFFTTKFTGRGLGLSAVLGIVRGHKGALKVYSKPGKGTTVKVLFPALAEGKFSAEQGGAPKAGTWSWKGAGTILVVDDEESVRTLGTRMLERIGFKVLVAADGQEALDIYRKRRDEIALILLDLTMPGMSGLETFQAIRRMQPDLPIIVTSGHDADDVAHQFPPGTIAQYFQKPYSMSELRGVVQSVIMRNDAP